MSLNEQPTERDSFRQKEIKDTGNSFLLSLIKECARNYGKLFAIHRDFQTQDDEGIDYQIEIFERTERQSVITFAIQNKSVDPPHENGIQTLIQGDGIGKIRFSISIKHIRYFREQKPEAVIITLVDIKTSVVYWHPIQLDDEVEKAIEKALQKNAKSITIYFDPTKKLNATSFPLFLEDVRLSDLTQGYRFHKNLHLSLVPAAGSKTGRPLDDIFEHFKLQYQLISYVPLEILGNHYPFKIKEKTLLPLPSFHMATDNQDFFNLFKSIQRIDDSSIQITDLNAFPGVDNPLEKLTAIMHWLTNNGIYFLEFFSPENRLSQPRPRINTFLLPKETNTTGAITMLRQLNYGKLLSKIKTQEFEDGNSLQHAYIHYKIGNYRTANRILKEVGRNTSIGTLQNYLTKFNRRHCLNGLRLGYQSDYEIVEAIKEVREIDLDLEVKRCQPSERLAIEWIHNNEYYGNYEYEISKIVSEIKSNYHAQLRGGWSDNHLVSRLVSTYNAFESFIKQNMLFYDQYNNFTKITELFVEGLFAAYSIKPKGGSRLDTFDDWIVHKIIQDADASKLLKMARNYDINGIIYKRTGIHKNTFEDIVMNFISEIENLPGLVKEVEDVENGSFWKKYNKQLWTILVMAGLLKLDEPFARSLVNKLIQLIKSVDLIYAGTYQYLMFFLQRHCKYIGKEEFKQLIFILLDKEHWDREETLEALEEISEYRKLKLQLDQSEFDRLYHYFLGREMVDQTIPNLMEACFIIPMLDQPEHCEVWINEIINRIYVSFDKDVFFYLIINDFISLDLQLFETFKGLILNESTKLNAQIIELKKENPIVPSFFGEQYGDYRINVNHLLDVVFKFNITLPESEIKQISTINLYYHWLTNISGFDYDLFLPEWVNRHKSIFFIREFRKHPQLRAALEKYLFNNDDYIVSRVYFHLFHAPKADDLSL